MKRQRKQGRFKKRRVAGAAAVLLLILGIASGVRLGVKRSLGDAASQRENVDTKYELTEEEIEILESQEGVTVSEDGIMEIDISDQFAR